MDNTGILRLIHSAKEEGASRLDLSNRGLVSLPDEIGDLPDLQMLYLTNNELTTLPKTLGQLRNLGGLYLENNRLQSLPEELGQLVNLQELYLSNNRLKGIPATLGRLRNLVTLRLESNHLESLPRELGNLRNLHVLVLSDNLLTSIPGTVEHWVNLRFLSLARNNLGSIPETISQLVNVEELDLSKNELTSVPTEVGDLRMLRLLNLKNNPLISPRPEVIEQGTEATLAYLRELARGKKRRYEAKLLILGDGGEGKTCLSRALRRERFLHLPQTEGVEQQTWRFKNPKYPNDEEKTITLNIWDFQGQEIHHQTHKFFLTEKLLYLLVINGRRAFRMDRAEYWLDTIRARAPESRVILVATECEHTVPFWPLDQLKEWYGDLLEGDQWFFCVGCETDKGIPELSAEIQRAVANMRVMGVEWPTSYERAEEMIRCRSGTSMESYIRRQDLYGIFRRSEISEIGWPTVARQMAALGLITEFPDSPDLADFIVLKPKWLTKAISHVMEDSQLAQERGKITHERMRQIWERSGYRGLYASFHNCMREFELCYDIDRGDECMVPLWFGDVKPRIPWSAIPGTKVRRVEYHLGKRPPKGVMSLFIVKTHHLIHRTREMPTGVYWQNGVFLRTGKEGNVSEALCELDADRLTFSIEVHAAFPQNMIEQLHGFAKAVFGFFEGLEPERGYGCVRFGSPEQAEPTEEQCPGVHPERRILFALSQSHKIDCERGWHIVDPRQLVYGLSTFGEVASTIKGLPQALADKPVWAQGLIRDMMDCLVWLDKIYAKVRELHESRAVLSAEMRQQVELGMREYLRMLSEMLDNRDFSAVPGIISIAPTDRSPFHPKSWFEKEYRITPYCECDEEVHHVHFSIPLTRPLDWWQKTAPKLAVGLRVLTAGLQIAFAGMPVVISNPAYEAIQREVDFMKELVKHLELTGGATSDTSEETDRIWRGRKWAARVFDLRDVETGDTKRIARFQLAALFKDIAPACYGGGVWGSLRRVRMSDNTYRWLCPKHAREYRR